MKTNKTTYAACFLAMIFIIGGVFILPSKNINTASASTYTSYFVGYSGDKFISDAEMFSQSNTYDYTYADPKIKERYLYDLSAKNGSKVFDGAPAITVFTHGYGANASHWSNDGSDSKINSEFAYDPASVIYKVAEKAEIFANGANTYWARCKNNDFRLIDLNVQSKTKAYSYANTEKTLSYITYNELEKHMIIIFQSDNAQEANNVVYDELNYMLSKIAYDIKYLTGRLPKINLAGHSRGGLTNLQYALDHPDMVESLISIGTPYSGGHMMENDDILRMVGFNPASDGILDIKNNSLQGHYRLRWNGYYNKLYKHINAHALGGFSKLEFLKNIINEAGTLPGGVDKNLILTAIDWWSLNGIFSWFADLSAQEEAMLETLKKSIERANIFSPYYMNDDLVVDLGSQTASGYEGFKQAAEQFGDVNEFNKRSAWSQPPIVHNLETYSNWFVGYLPKNISVDNMNPFITVASGHDNIISGLKSWVTLSDSVVIPAQINGKTITGTGIYAFQGQTGITSVSFESGSQIQTIGEGTFKGCTGLTDIIIPDSVKIIGDSAFRLCRSLTTISLPKDLTKIEPYSFSECEKLSFITIPTSVTKIETYAFAGCSGLTGLILPENLKLIEAGAFKNCSSLKNVIVPDSVEEIGLGAFEGCDRLESITLPFAGAKADEGSFGFIFGADNIYLNDVYIPDSLKTVTLTRGERIRRRAFFNCNSIVNIAIPGSVKTIEESAFYACSSLKSITGTCSVVSIGSSAFGKCESLSKFIMSDSVISIGEFAFSGCSGLEEVKLSNSLKELGQYAFSNCSKLTKIEIPSLVEGVSKGAFSGCISLSKVDLKNNNTAYIGDYAFENCISVSSITTKPYITYFGNYSFKGCTALKNISIPSKVTAIGNGAFKDCNNLSSVSMPNALNIIGDYAFENCVKLTTLTIPANVTAIGEGAFSGCSNVTSLSTQNKIEFIGSYAFSGCTKLKSVKISSVMTEIGNSAFADCVNLNSVTFSGNIERIGDYTFENCSSLTDILLPNSATKIGKGAFAGCNKLQSITIPFVGNERYEASNAYFGYIFGASDYLSQNDSLPQSLKSVTVTTGGQIKNGAFSGCSVLTSVTLSGSITSIGSNAFSLCGNLKNISLPDSLSYIGESAFSNCNSLESIEIPYGAAAIKAFSFWSCGGLTSVSIPKSVTSIENRAFSFCTSLTDIIIPDSVVIIRELAFWNCISLTSVKLSNKLAIIEDSAFSLCNSLPEISLPDSLISIGSYAFSNCAGLMSLTVPNNVRSMGSDAVSGIGGAVYVESTMTPYNWNGSWNSSNKEVIWGCKLSADKSYVVSFTRGAGSISNLNESSVITAPYRKGFIFAGWTTQVNGITAEYTAEGMHTAPNGTTLYAIWI